MSLISRASSSPSPITTIFFPIIVPVPNHAVEIQCEQMRFHLCHQRFEAIEMGVAVVQVVHDADVRDSVALQTLDDRDLVLGFAKPAAMIVESYFQSERISCCRQGLNPRCFAFHLSFLLGCILTAAPAPLIQSCGFTWCR